jgi:hypothetical protein
VLEHAGLESQHLAVVRLVVVAAEMEHAVNHCLDQVLGALRADHHIAQFPRPRNRPSLIDREGEDIGRLIEPAVLAVQALDLVLAYQCQCQVPVADPSRGQRAERWTSQRFRGLDEVELDQPCCRRASRSAGACFSAYSL